MGTNDTAEGGTASQEDGARVASASARGAAARGVPQAQRAKERCNGRNGAGRTPAAELQVTKEAANSIGSAGTVGNERAGVAVRHAATMGGAAGSTYAKQRMIVPNEVCILPNGEGARTTKDAERGERTSGYSMCHALSERIRQSSAATGLGPVGVRAIRDAKRVTRARGRHSQTARSGRHSAKERCSVTAPRMEYVFVGPRNIRAMVATSTVIRVAAPTGMASTLTRLVGGTAQTTQFVVYHTQAFIMRVDRLFDDRALAESVAMYMPKTTGKWCSAEFRAWERTHLKAQEQAPLQ